ncbi:pyridoxamine 5'-phosphate oxidase family protein [Candidatus Poriferisocius sp.]|uniref:pyridoxamine 5'-phosphate oxidase family protein n=1 Tax=Candidatus Poriferisocius sp. TaxID=3101276 RepID=UPI003B5B9C70
MAEDPGRPRDRSEARPAGRPTVRMTPEECWEMLETSVNGTLTTLRANGQPVALPVWYVVLDHKIYVVTRGKKVTRVRNDSRCSFLVESGERWAELRAVHVECAGEVIEPSEELAGRITLALDEKYARYRTAGDEMPRQTQDYYRKNLNAVIQLTPVGKMLNWDNAKLL